MGASSSIIRSAAHRAASAAATLAGKPALPPLPAPVRPKSTPARQPVQENVDATKERLAHSVDEDGARHYAIIDATIEKAGERARLTRRFADSAIDKMRTRGHLTYSQWYACDWFATLHASAHSMGRVVASYGEGVGGVGIENYGQPLTGHQWDARKRLRAARSAIPANMLGLFERVVIEDSVPAFQSGRQRARFAQRIATVAQGLAEWLNAPGA